MGGVSFRNKGGFQDGERHEWDKAPDPNSFSMPIFQT